MRHEFTTVDEVRAYLVENVGPLPADVRIGPVIGRYCCSGPVMADDSCDACGRTLRPSWNVAVAEHHSTLLVGNVQDALIGTNAQLDWVEPISDLPP